MIMHTAMVVVASIRMYLYCIPLSNTRRTYAGERNWERDSPRGLCDHPFFARDPLIVACLLP